MIETVVSQRVLIIGSVWPEPDSSAAGQNMIGIIGSFLAHGWAVSFTTAASDSVHKADLTALGVQVFPTRINSDLFDRQVDELQPHVVVFDRFMTEEQFSWRVKKTCPEAMLLLNTEDLHFLRHSRHNAIKSGKEETSSLADSDIAYREIASILRCDLSLIISDAELSLLQTNYGVPASQLIHIPLFISSVTTELLPFEKRQGFASIGNFRHAPNWDAVLTLKQHIWPQIRKQLPDATLCVYGAYPPKKATDLHSPQSGFLVKGWVADAAQALAAARVLLAPLRFGAGVKGKLILAMQTNTPSITTSVGVEGIACREDWPGAVQDTWPGFVHDAVSLYRDQAKWQHSVDRGNNIICEKFDSEKSQQHLISCVNTIQRDLSNHRKQHFQQNMLWHHTLRSTQYMSQWIEAKNKNSG